MMTVNINTTTQITNFLRFANRPPKGFIERIWKDDQDYELVKGKYFRRSFVDFFMLLDIENKQRLINFIQESYTV